MVKENISIWEFLFGGSLLSVCLVIVLLFLGVAAIVFFIQKLMALNRENQVDPYLLKNVNDLLNDGRIQSAVDFCKRDNSPESRSVEKGLSRLGRPVGEIANAMETHAQIELNKAEKNINFLATVSGAAPMLGLLGGILILASTFGTLSKTETVMAQNLLAADFYKALAPSAVGLTVGFLSYIFHNILVSKVDYTLMKIQYHTNEFLDIINKPS
ncbi:MotA/TolQ/ExbB proton channel family protein [Epilithonimonas mollis]|uniref:Outer membrane transport energization protein ExbB n=1 Tax=Epilithonimonas mollis TaxID=216903 RepID=A0A1M6PU47_9FLAO|nr:MotA/TolQ/ExbB proton channel family protein [Epilithonimonas mollis]SHK11442.1 outer membrane transport energization protein ExbB [Epilithonimonas mollis]